MLSVGVLLVDLKEYFVLFYHARIMIDNRHGNNKLGLDFTAVDIKFTGSI